MGMKVATKIRAPRTSGEAMLSQHGIDRVS